MKKFLEHLEDFRTACAFEIRENPLLATAVALVTIVVLGVICVIAVNIVPLIKQFPLFFIASGIIFLYLGKLPPFNK